MQGKIIKGIAGFYYVNISGLGTYECKAKGVFRNKKIKPLVGDIVEIKILDEEKKIGNVVDIKDRHNELIRPAVTNIDQAIIIFAITEPEPNLNLLDRFLISMNRQGIPAIICFNKRDIASQEQLEYIKNIYDKTSYKVYYTSANSQADIKTIKQMYQEMIKGKTTAFAGPSGVGKSSMLNIISQEISTEAQREVAIVTMETGEISSKIKRGKHTTRHSELVYIDHDTYIMDTPGFSTLFIEDIESDNLKDYYTEFHQYEGNCRFQGCIHVNEPACGVKEAVESDKISKERYKVYLEIYYDLKGKKRY